MLNSRFLGVVLTALSSVVFAQSSTRSLYSFTPNQTPTSYLKNLDCAVTFNETRDQPIPKSTDCHAYTFISARGTGESQSQAVSTTAIYPAILASIPGGVYYELEYPATRDFINSGLAGINNLTNYILQKQAACPNEKLIIVRGAPRSYLDLMLTISLDTVKVPSWCTGL